MKTATCENCGRQLACPLGCEPEDESVESACSTDLPDEVFDAISTYAINQWFDHWLIQEARTPGRTKAPMVERLRRLALAGAKKGQQNKAAVRAEVVQTLKLIAGSIENETFPIQ